MAHNRTESHGGEKFPTNTAAVIGGGTPSNAYVAEDGTTFYVAEDGTTYYVQEA